jgi:hypothetical protein
MSTREFWRLSLIRGAQWRYLALFVVGMLLPTILALVPLVSFFQSLLDRSPRSADLVARLDSPALTEVIRQLGEPAGMAIGPGLLGALFVALVVGPALAGATAALARERGAPMTVRGLLGGAGEFYPRMLRMAVAACVPLGMAGGGAALALHFANKSSEHAVLESAGNRAMHVAMAVSVVLVWLAHVTVDAGCAHFAAAPERKSALVAWWSGVRLTVRHPVQVLALCFLTTVAGVGGALLVTALRFRLVQAGPLTIALAFALAQLAVAAIAWGRSSRLVGLVELIRRDSPP